MSEPTLGWIRRALLLAGLATAASGCHREQLVVYERAPIPLGRSFEVVAGRHYWPFRAHPGEKYHLVAEWPDGKLDIRAGSDRRDHEELDDDDAEDVTPASIQSVGPHRFEATWVIGPKANTGFVAFNLNGDGIDPVKIEIDRE
jgi:hypothetical protein